MPGVEGDPKGQASEAPTQVQGDEAFGATVDVNATLAATPVGKAPPPDSLLAELVSTQERYELRGALGEGGMGEVRLCEDRRIGRQVAMKMLHADVRGRIDLSRRFLREARLQGQLEHPAIVPVYDLGFDEAGAPFFTMKRVEGATLADIVETLRHPDAEPRFSTNRLLRAFCTACLALDYAHARGVLHCDLKPANVMLGEFGEVYVLDWGLARLVDTFGTSGPVSRAQPDSPPPGTPGYLAPEQREGAPLDARTDVFGLGEILFELLALEPLQQLDSPVAVERRPSQRAPTRKVPLELDAVCSRATATSPDDRYPSARSLHDAVLAFVERDSDAEMRAKLATEHALRAQALAERARSEGAGEESLRSEAMRAVGRALALDPRSEVATRTLAHLLGSPPRETPPEVQDDMRSARKARQRIWARDGAYLYLTWFLYLPVILYAGVRSVTLLAVCSAPFVTLSVYNLVLSRRPHPDGQPPLGVLALNALGVGLLSTVAGPLIIVPCVAIASTSAYIFMSEGRRQWVALALGCLSVVGPIVLSALGIVPPSYAYRGGAMIVLPHLIDLAKGTSLIGLIVTHLVLLVTMIVSCARLRVRLSETETVVQLHAWQLRRLLPDADPAGRPSSPPSIRAQGNADAGSNRSPRAVTTGVSGGGAADESAAAALTTEDERYQVKGELGEGGMGRVELCVDHRIGREVARKVVRREHATRHDLTARFLHEARTQAQLMHPSVVPVYDIGADRHGATYFTMKRVRGTTLESLLDQWRRDPEATTVSLRKLLTAWTDVCHAVEFAHASGVLHCDLKPSNIMLGDYGELYVLDWGVAAPSAHAGEEPLKRPLLGTPGYMAPEQVRGEPLDAKTDIYALGAILFEILAREPLHRGKNAAAILRATLESPERRPSVRAPDRDVPPELEMVCVKATAPSKEDRFATVRDLATAVERFLEGDRDLARRRALAEEHARHARVAAEHAIRSTDVAARATAMSEVSRALALDPSNREATAALVELLTKPPRDLPAETKLAMEDAEIAARRASARLGAYLYMAWFIFAPLAIFAGVQGVRSLPAFLFTSAAFLGAVGAFLHLSRSLRRGTRAVLLPPVGAAIAGASVAACVGPFVLVPMIALGNAAAFLLGRTHHSLRTVMALGGLTMLLPLVLEEVGVVPPSYSFRDGALVILPRMLELPEATTMTFVSITTVGVMLAIALWLIRFRRVLDRAQHQAVVFDWQLRQLVPPGARRAASLPP